jgi:hypothetical protein
VALALLAACKSGEDEVEAPLPPLTPFDPALEERLHAIRDRMSEIRGLPPFERIEEGWFTPEALRAYNETNADLSREELGAQADAWNIAYKLLHLIGPEEDLLDSSVEGGDDIVGLYFFYLDRLALIYGGEELTPQDEITLAHEYVHSFQDARWNVDELNKLAEQDADENSNTEFQTTLDCLIEGDATVAMYAYAAEVYGPDWIEEIYGGDEEATEPEPAEEELSPALQRYFQFNYNECAIFVATIFAAGGWDAVDAMYDDPPRSTEAILHPDRYLNNQDIGSIVPLPELHEALEGWERLSLLPFGEFDLLVYLSTLLGDEGAAGLAAAGWDGGRSAIYTREKTDGGQNVLVHIAMGFDSADSNSLFLRAFRDIVAAYTEAIDPEAVRSVRWTEESAYGAAWWDPGVRRFDLLLGDDEGAVTEAAEAAGAP